MTEECPACGTWECLDCGWTRSGAARDGESGEVQAGVQSCFKCGSSWGRWHLTKHRGYRAWDHRESWLREQEQVL